MAAVSSYRLLSLSLVTCGLLVALSEGESELSKIGGRGSLARLVSELGRLVECTSLPLSPPLSPSLSLSLPLSLPLSPPLSLPPSLSPPLSLPPSPSLSPPISTPPPSLPPSLSLQGYQLEVVGVCVKNAQQEHMLIAVSQFTSYMCAPTDISLYQIYHFRTSFICVIFCVVCKYCIYQFIQL